MLTTLKALVRRGAENIRNVWVSGSGISVMGKVRKNDIASQVAAFENDVYNFVDYRAETLAAVTGKIYYYDKKNDRHEAEKHPFYELINRPNPVQTRSELMYLTESWLCLTGNCYWYLPLSKLGIPAQILPIPPEFMKVVPDSKEIISGYIYEREGKKIPFELSEITHFRLPNPKDPYYYGMSPIEAQSVQINTLESIGKYQKAMFDNMGSPSLFVKLRDEYSKQLGNNKVKRDEFMNEFSSMFEGVRRSGKSIVHPAIENVVSFLQGNHEVGYLNSQEAVRKMLSNTYRVPLSLMFDRVGSLGRAEMETDYYRFHKDAIRPRLQKIADTITKDILGLYDEGWEYEFENTVPEDKEFALKLEESRLRNWVLSVNEVRELAGQEPVAWGNVPLAPFSIAPLSTEPRGGEQVNNATPAIGASVKDISDAENVVDAKLFKPIVTDELREKHWNAFIRSTSKIEKEWGESLRGMSGEHEKIILKNLKDLYGKGYAYQSKGVAEMIMISEERAAADFWMASERGVKRALDDGVSLGEAQIGVPGVITEPDLHFRGYLEKKQLKIKTIPAKNYHGVIKSAIQKGIESGQDYEAMRETIKKAFEGYNVKGKDWEIDRIVRTETTSSVNHAQEAVAIESGLVEAKKWMAALQNTRDTHNEAHGQEVLLNQSFTVGGYDTPYPGETGAPEEDINCQCSVIYGVYQSVN